MPVTHTFQSAKADGGDATLVQPSNWNASHSIDTITTIQDAATPMTVTRFYLNAVATYNGYVEANLKNTSNGASASSDYIVTADDGDGTTKYADFGINGSGYSVGTWTINGAGDAYLYAQTNGLAVGTAAAGKPLVFFTGGTLAANNRFQINDDHIDQYVPTVGNYGQILTLDAGMAMCF